MTALTKEIKTDVNEPGLESRFVGEMLSSDPDSGGLKVPPNFLEKVKAKDDDPQFVTVEVDSGWSRSKRRWKPEHLEAVVNKVNSSRMSGNLGHPLLDPEKHKADFPKPQVVWVAAKLRSAADKATATIKGYVLKTAEAREYLDLGLIDGISIFGHSTMKPVQGGYDVLTFEPETIDFARKGQSGMPSRILALTGEQHSEGGSVEPKDIAALSEDELRTHAPLLVKEIERKVTEPLNTKVGEMTTAVEGLKPEVDVLGEIKKLLKVQDGESVLDKVTGLVSQIEDAATSEIKDFIKELVGKKVKSTRGQALVNRLIGEMDTEYDGPLDDDLKKKIEKDFNDKLDGDETIKGLVGEMATWTDESTEGKNGGGSSLGGRSRLGEKRGGTVVGDDGAVVRKTGNLTVRKVRL